MRGLVVVLLVLVAGCSLFDAPTGPSTKVCPFVIATRDTIILSNGVPVHVTDTTRRCF